MLPRGMHGRIRGAPLPVPPGGVEPGGGKHSEDSFGAGDDFQVDIGGDDSADEGVVQKTRRGELAGGSAARIVQRDPSGQPPSFFEDDHAALKNLACHPDREGGVAGAESGTLPLARSE